MFKNLSILFIVFSIASCGIKQTEVDTKISEEETAKDSIPKTKSDAIVVSEKRKRTYSLVDKSKFPYQKIDSTDFNYKLYKTLPLITEFEGSGYAEGKYYSNQTFRDDFNSYVFAVFEGGDCGPGLLLVNCKEDKVLSQQPIFNECGWENANFITSTTFLNDSTFKVYTTGQSKIQTEKGEYIVDSVTHKVNTQTFLITSHGSIQQVSKTDTSWNAIKN